MLGMNSDAIRNETRGNLTVHVCNDCQRWAHEGQAIVHSKRCDTPDAQPAALAAPTTKSEIKAQRSAREIKRLGASGTGLTDDEIRDAHARGIITTSGAMNRDD